MVVPNGGALGNPRDFEGKTIALISLASISSLATREWLRRGGADDTKVYLIECRSAQLSRHCGAARSTVQSATAGLDKYKFLPLPISPAELIWNGRGDDEGKPHRVRRTSRLGLRAFCLPVHQRSPMSLKNVNLSIATTDYDHFRDFRTGVVTAEGIDHSWTLTGHHEVFARMTLNREWDVSELSFAKFAAQISRDDRDILGLPVICSRLFRFSSFYVNKKSGIKTVEDLKGKKIGSPEWAHSAAVYMRGWMHNDMGVKLTDVHWYQAGANAPGREEKVELSLPAGVRLTRIADKSLSEMLASGEIDCAIIARPPTCFLEGHPDIVRLFPDYLEMEEEYYQRTKVWPIMHIIAIQKRVLDENPWVARNLYNAFLESKRRSIERLLDPAVSRYPLAWLPTYARKMRDMFGGDPFPYGIDENRKTFEQLALYTYQQGIAHRLMDVDDMFPKGVMTKVII
jgi:4,5-dihydroxyphthalate decarboxylase